MEREMILYPVFAMVLLTVYTTIRLGKQRVKAVVEDGLTPGYFYYNKGGRLPEYLLRTEQHYVNLFELPVLFYAGAILAYTAAWVDVYTLSLAWLFVLSRGAHAYIHMKLNRLMPRRHIFIASVFVLTALWIDLFVWVVM